MVVKRFPEALSSAQCMQPPPTSEQRMKPSENEADIVTELQRIRAEEVPCGV